MIGALGLVAACHPDLPPCDEAAAHEVVVYDAVSDVSDDDGIPMYLGQGLAYVSCGAGVACHSDAATGTFRFGVPHGFDFDVAPAFVDVSRASDAEATARLRTGVGHLREYALRAYGDVVDGVMPPSHSRVALRPTRATLRRTAPSMTSLDDPRAEEVPGLESAASRRALGVWLACGAPIVGAVREPDGTHAAFDPCDEVPGIAGDCLTRLEANDPPFGEPPFAPNCPDGSANWDELFVRVVGPLCAATCHGSNELNRSSLRIPSDSASAYARMLMEDGEETLVRPFDPDGSHLVHHVEGLYGLRVMPPGLMSRKLSSETIAAIRSWIEHGALRSCD